MINLNKAIELLKNGEVIAAPTETVYGLFGDSKNDIAIQNIYKAKGRPSCNPLISHISSIEMGIEIADFTDIAIKIAEYFWINKKSPLTIILKQKKICDISRFVTASLDTIALRIPNHEIALDLIKGVNRPLAAPSANTSMAISPTSADMVKSDLGSKIPLILDGGKCEIGIESTILDLTLNDPVILRHGGLPQEQIEQFLGRKVFTAKDLNITEISAPGMMKKHYSPSIPVRINAAYPNKNEAFIAFGKTDIKYDFNLSIKGDLNEAAKNLFYALKQFDKPNLYSGIAIMPIKNIDIGVGINDRLSRASVK